MMRLNVDYTKQQVMQDIKAIEELREEDIKLPLAVLRREEPKALRKAFNKEIKRERRDRPENKERRKAYHQSEKFRNYQKARSKSLYILRARHPEEFVNIFKEVKTGDLFQLQIAQKSI